MATRNDSEVLVTSQPSIKPSCGFEPNSAEHAKNAYATSGNSPTRNPQAQAKAYEELERLLLGDGPAPPPPKSWEKKPKSRRHSNEARVVVEEVVEVVDRSAADRPIASVSTGQESTDANPVSVDHVTHEEKHNEEQIKSPEAVTPPPKEDSSTAKEFQPQTFNSFMAKPHPAKQELIEGVLYRRDRISLTGRRRNGKTTFLLNLALAGAFGQNEYLGYRIVKPFTTIAFYLEDDPGELQDKLRKMAKGQQTDRFHLYTREDLFDQKIPIDLRYPKFITFIENACGAAKPDVILFDNLGQLVRGDYNNPKEIQILMELVFRLGRRYNAAVLIAAHPKKGSRLNQNGSEEISLRKSPEAFFEECMGSSHFINSTGSLWGIERDYDKGRSYLLLGSQRVNSNESLTVVEKDDENWLRRLDDKDLAVEVALNTSQRRDAWDLLPEAPSTFTFSSALAAVKKAISSKSTFNSWWADLLRNKLILPTEPGGRQYCKAVKVSFKNVEAPAQ